MQLTDLLAQTGGLMSMARELGISEDQAASGVAALAPAILGGIKTQAQQHPDGVAGLGGLLAQLGGGGLLDSVLGPQPTDVSQGNGVLGRIFGSREVSRTVANDASARTGLDPELLKRMLPIVAMMVTGALAKQGGGDAAATPVPAAGGLGGVLGGLLGGLASGGGTPSPAAHPGLLSMLDLNGDGNPLDDILQAAGRIQS
jgi:hypothetical protein